MSGHRYHRAYGVSAPAPIIAEVPVPELVRERGRMWYLVDRAGDWGPFTDAERAELEGTARWQVQWREVAP